MCHLIVVIMNGIQGVQSLYEYCFENGETTNVNEILNQQIIVYPNPTLDIINFSSQINFTTSFVQFNGTENNRSK